MPLSGDNADPGTAVYLANLTLVGRLDTDWTGLAVIMYWVFSLLLSIIKFGPYNKYSFIAQYKENGVGG